VSEFVRLGLTELVMEQAGADGNFPITPEMVAAGNYPQSSMGLTAIIGGKKNASPRAAAVGPDAIAAQGTPQAPQFQQALMDRVGSLEIDAVSYLQLKRALQQANLGNMWPLADVEDLILTHPIIAGIVDQRIAGLNSVPREVTAADDSPEATRYADEFKAEIDGPDSSWPMFERTCTLLRICGGGLIEILWRLDGTRWKIAGFVPVPRQRFRFDPETGAPGFAPNKYNLYGIPTAMFRPGTFATIVVDERLMDFGKRGVLRSLINAWWALVNVGGQWQQRLERYGVPPLDVSSDDPEERERAKEEARTFGASSVFVHGTGTTILPLSLPVTRGQLGTEQSEFEASRARWVAIRLLGAEQTVSVSSSDGSQESAGLHKAIRQDILMGDAEMASFVGRRDVAVAWMIQNYGIEKAYLAPKIEYLFPQPTNVTMELANIDAALNLGFDRATDEAYEAIGWRKPADGEQTIGAERKKVQEEQAQRQADQQIAIAKAQPQPAAKPGAPKPATNKKKAAGNISSFPGRNA